MITRRIPELLRVIKEKVDRDAELQVMEIIAERERWYREVREYRRGSKIPGIRR
jgi:hypothetical protein